MAQSLPLPLHYMYVPNNPTDHIFVCQNTQTNVKQLDLTVPLVFALVFSLPPPYSIANIMVPAPFDDSSSGLWYSPTKGRVIWARIVHYATGAAM
jgi:hypothetical protein